MLLHKRPLQRIDRHPILTLVVVTGLGVALGAVWEIVEWAGSQVWGDPNFREARRDVITDLIYDTVGALLGALAGLAVLRRDRASR